MLSTSFCVNCRLAFSSSASLAVSLTTSSKRLFVVSRNDCRHAWNAVCCTAICFTNTSSCRASALLTMASMSGPGREVMTTGLSYSFQRDFIQYVTPLIDCTMIAAGQYRPHKFGQSFQRSSFLGSLLRTMKHIRSHTQLRVKVLALCWW